MLKDKLQIFIMAGGIGSRFWPKSRNDMPKQFIDILGVGKTLIQLTAERFYSLTDIRNINIITNSNYRDIIRKQLANVPLANIICEPSRNNTAPCIALAAFKLFKENPNSIMIIVPSDHLVLKEDEFRAKLKVAIDCANEFDVLVTLGIKPTRPDTGYGYIQIGEMFKDSRLIHEVLSFKEKPNELLAKEFVDSGEYLWNAGIFVWKASSIINAFKLYCNEIYTLFNNGMKYYNTENEENYLQENYSKSTNISIDFAIMEKADNVVILPTDIGWSDLGTWNSLHVNCDQKDGNNNAIFSNNVLLNETNNCIISASDDKLVVVDGLKDYIIVDEKNALLIYPMSKEQSIKVVTDDLKINGLNKYL